MSRLASLLQYFFLAGLTVFYTCICCFVHNTKADDKMADFSEIVISFVLYVSNVFFFILLTML